MTENGRARLCSMCVCGRGEDRIGEGARDSRGGSKGETINLALNEVRGGT